MASLLITREGEPAKRFSLSEHNLVSVGRDDQCTVQVLDEEVSRRHLQVKLDEGSGRHVAVDARSANGVFINGHRIGRDVRLEDGDQIAIGESKILYTLVDDPDAAQIEDVIRRRGQRLRSTITGQNISSLTADD